MTPKLDAARIEEIPSEAEVFRKLHDLLEGIVQIGENHGFKRGDDFQVWLAQSLRALSAPEPVALPHDRLIELARMAVGNVCEWDDRTSPEGYEEYLFLKPEELSNELIDFANEILAVQIAASPSNPPRGEVKALEWERVTERGLHTTDAPKRFWRADSVIGGNIYINVHTDDFDGEASWGGQKFTTAAAAMNAAEDHRARRILSALKPIEPEISEEMTSGLPHRAWIGAADADNEHEVWFDPDEGGTPYVRADLVSPVVDIETIIDAVMEVERVAPKTIPMGANPPLFDGMQPDNDGPWVSRVAVAKRLRAALNGAVS